VIAAKAKTVDLIWIDDNSSPKAKAMRSTIYWIEAAMTGRLAIMARPRAGEWLADEVAGWRAAGIDVVVSLLEMSEIRELALEQEPDLCRQHAIAFMSLPIPDHGIPESWRQVAILVAELAGHLEHGRSIAIHCRAGIGRSALLAAVLMIKCGQDAKGVFAAIARARGVAVPDTDQQRDWVLE
jgi:hypothetical protein